MMCDWKECYDVGDLHLKRTDANTEISLCPSHYNILLNYLYDIQINTPFVTLSSNSEKTLLDSKVYEYLNNMLKDTERDY